MREMLIHYEQRIEQKDQTEENLCKAVDLLQQKTASHHFYYRWRLAYLEKRQENHALALAQNYYEEKLKRVRAVSRHPSPLHLLPIENVQQLETDGRTRMEENLSVDV